MPDPELQRVKRVLKEAGVEIYRTRAKELQIAERIRMHIMDSGIRVLLPAEESGSMSLSFTARSQRSDRPSASHEEHLEQVREKIGAEATGRGYGEAEVRATEVLDPMDDSKVLDVWHEVTYSRAVDGDEALLEELRWALALEKYVSSN